MIIQNFMIMRMQHAENLEQKILIQIKWNMQMHISVEANAFYVGQRERILSKRINYKYN